MRIANSPCCGRSGDVLAILYPADASETVECLALGRAHGVPLHIVSRGCNWGYGSLQPPNGRAAVASLRRLNAIRLSDPKLGRIRLQPGVTFGELAAWLQREAPDWLAPAIGAGPDVSVIGNALAGGIGKGPYGWMARHLSELALASADGRPERASGLGRSGAASLPAGSAVLEADFQLRPAPAYRALAWARLADGAAAFAAAFRLACRGVEASEGFEQAELLNGARLRLQSPLWCGPPGEGAHAGWAIGVTINGRDEAEAAARLSAARDRLAHLPVHQAGALRPEPAATAAPPGREGLASTYAAIGRDPPPDADPDRDGCGVRWIAAFLPTEAHAAAAALAALGATAERHGFAPALAVRFPDGDPVGLLGLFWSRRGPGAKVAAADARAVACASACRDVAARLGLSLHRDRRG